MSGNYLRNGGMHCRQKDSMYNLCCKLNHSMIDKSKKPIVTRDKEQGGDGFKMMLKKHILAKPGKVLKAMLKN